MKTSSCLKVGSAILCLLASVLQARAEQFNVPDGDLKAALDSYTEQSGTLLVVSSEAIKGIHSKGVRGDLSSEEALSRILAGTGFVANHHSASAVMIVPEIKSEYVEPLQIAQAAPSRAAVETVTVTSSKLGGADVQSIPISITALAGTVNRDANGRWTGLGEAGAEYDVYQNQFLRLQHPITRYRHTGDLGDNRSSGRGCL